MITIPVLFTPISLNETKKESSGNEETISKMIQNTNWLLELRPIGSILLINTNQFGVEAPDSNVFQYCDGSEITHPSSPLRSVGLNTRFTPDLRGKFPRCSNNYETNETGGSWEHQFSHSHSVGTQTNYGSGVDKKGARQQEPPHSHGIYGALEGDSDNPKKLEAPAYFVVNAYIKIN